VIRNILAASAAFVVLAASVAVTAAPASADPTMFCGPAGTGASVYAGNPSALVLIWY
jgi:hypothetical protein